MTTNLPAFLAGPPPTGDEVSVTGKWVPARKGGIFRKSPDSHQMIKQWQDIHNDAQRSPGILSTEVDLAIGEEAVLVHHVFADSQSMEDYFAATATEHAKDLLAVAKPELHLVRGRTVSPGARAGISSKGVPAKFGEWDFGYVGESNLAPDGEQAIQVTAQWSCQDDSAMEELTHWWQQVGTDAHSMEPGLLRFETYRVDGQPSLIIHETFADTKDLKFHLTKGTAEKYKKQIDKIASPDCYYFRGPVSWSIRTYSRFMRLPATYTSQGFTYARPGGNLSTGLDPHP